jgi:hypothetical protein
MTAQAVVTVATAPSSVAWRLHQGDDDAVDHVLDGREVRRAGKRGIACATTAKTARDY